MRGKILCCAIVLSFVQSLCAAQGDSNLSHVLSRLHTFNVNEIAAGKIAKNKGTEPRLREYASMLIGSQRAAEKELGSIAKQKGITIKKFRPQNSVELQELVQAQQMLRTLNKLGRSSEFDRYFADLMVRNNEAAVEFVSQARDQIDDEKIKAYLGNLIPELWRHRQLAASIRAGQDAESVDRTPAED